MRNVTKPRSKTQIGRLKFPFTYEKNGRKGKIYKLASGKFKTHYTFAGKHPQNTFNTFASAFQHLDDVFSNLDTQKAGAIVTNQAKRDLKEWQELEEILQSQGDGASLRDAVLFFVANRQRQAVKPCEVSAAVEAFIQGKETENLSPSQLNNLKKHFRPFVKVFGSRQVHEVTSQDFSTWLGSFGWSAKTRKNVRGSLCSLSIYCRDILKALPPGKTEFQIVKAPRQDGQMEVEIYRPEAFAQLLNAALENDVEMLPALVLGGFAGIRPSEFHAEVTNREPLKWEAINWRDAQLHITGQKVKSHATRDIPLCSAALDWLKPFKPLSGIIWQHRKAFDDKFQKLKNKADVESIPDGLRHSFASYRIRELKNDFKLLAREMGNSEREILKSYKRNVSDQEAKRWFGIMPPENYSELVNALLGSRPKV